MISIILAGFFLILMIFLIIKFKKKKNHQKMIFIRYGKYLKILIKYVVKILLI